MGNLKRRPKEKRVCVVCGADVKGFSQKCEACKEVQHRKSSAEYYVSEIAKLKRRPNIFGSYENFTRWAKNELENVDLAKYLPRTGGAATTSGNCRIPALTTRNSALLLTIFLLFSGRLNL